MLGDCLDLLQRQPDVVTIEVPTSGKEPRYATVVTGQAPRFLRE
jgi:hypothetical protein